MRVLTPTLSICALAATFTAGALTAAPNRPAPAAAHDPAPLSTDTAAVVETPAVTSATITIRDFAFEVPPVAAGSAVRIVNADTVPHTVTADDGSFDVFLDPGAESIFVVPATPGTYAFFCSVHPSMTSVLVVT